MKKRTRFPLGLNSLLVAGLFFVYSPVSAAVCPPANTDAIDSFESTCMDWTPLAGFTVHSAGGSLAPDTDDNYIGLTAPASTVSVSLLQAGFDGTAAPDVGTRDVVALAYAQLDPFTNDPTTKILLGFSSVSGLVRMRGYTQLSSGAPFAPTSWNHVFVSTNYLKNLGVPLASLTGIDVSTLTPANGEIYYDNLRRQNIGVGYVNPSNLTDTAMSQGASSCSILKIDFPTAPALIQSGGSIGGGAADGYHVYRSVTGPDSGYVSVGYVASAATTWSDTSRPAGTSWYKFLSINTTTGIAGSRLTGPEATSDDPAQAQWSFAFSPSQANGFGIIEGLLSGAAAYMNTNAFCPTATPSFSVSPTPTLSGTFTPSETPSPTMTVTPTFTPTTTFTITETGTFTPTPSITPTISSTFSPGPSGTNTPIFSPTITMTFSATPTITLTLTTPPTATITQTFTPLPSATVTCVCSPTASPTPMAASAVLYPNPFRPNDPDPAQRFLRVGSVVAGTVMTVYDIAGDKVWTALLVGDFKIDIWDGMNQNGEPVITGVYFVVLEQPTIGNSVHRIAVVR